MKCLSLFSGIGGFDLALQRQGHEIIGACEIDKYARQVYARHFQGITIHNDARTLSPESLPYFDMLCGGFPCQAFSVAGKRKGFDDTRGTLFFEIARIAREKKPRYLLLENVRGILSHDKGETFRTILATLDEIGYDAEWQIINSKYFVPQNRERIFIIWHLRGERTRQIFPLGDCGELDNNSRPETQEEGKRISGTIDSNYWKGGSRTMIAEPEIKYENMSESQANRVYNIDGIAPSLGVGHAMNTPNITVPVLTPDRLEKRQNGRRFKENGDPSFTLTSQDIHDIFDGKRIRRLTPVECERLQGFPDNYTDGLSDTQRYKCLGNAVTVPVVEYILSFFALQSFRSGK